MKRSVAFLLLVFLICFGQALMKEKGVGDTLAVAAANRATVLDRKGIIERAASLAVPFVRNAGRFDAAVRYSADLFAGKFFLTDRELVYSLANDNQRKGVHPGGKKARQKGDRTPAKGISFREFFVDGGGAKIRFKPMGEEKSPTKISYFKGNDPAKWQSGLDSYNNVSLGDVYPGIRVKLKASGKNVEKIFYISPGSDVARIRIGVLGANELNIAEDGRLLFKHGTDELAMRAPVAWQEIDGRRVDVEVSYRLLGKRLYGFTVIGAYSKNHPLVIDPELAILSASTYLGGNTSDGSMAIALDGSGNVYITGFTNSIDFPTTPRAFDRALNPLKYEDAPYGNSYPDDVFVSKLDRNLSTLLASTYLGGNRDEPNDLDMDVDVAYSLALDRAGNVYITGSTCSPDFPTTPGAFERRFNGGEEDAFVSKLNGNLTRLMASTFLGGSYSETGRSLVLDGSGNVFLTGYTRSENFPTTSGAYDRTRNGSDPWDWDIFISELDGDLSELLASTYLGGKESDQGFSLALDCSGDVYLTGSTASKNFPTSNQAYDRTYNGDNNEYSPNGDVIIAKLDRTLTQLLAATFLGGSSNEIGFSLALDRAGNIYLSGGTSSEDFPTTPGAYDRTYNGDDPVYYTDKGDAFISKFTGDLSRLLASTFLGGTGSEKGNSLVLDNSGKVYVIGETNSTDFPTILGAYDRSFNGGKYYYARDVFISLLDRDLSSLRASTFLGGGFLDHGYALALDGSGSVYATGITWSTNFPTTPGAFDREHHSIFVSRLNGGPVLQIELVSPDGGESWVAGTVHDISWTSIGKIDDLRIEVSADNGKSWSEEGVSPARYRMYSWTVPNAPSRKCLVRVGDIDHANISDTSKAVFTILMSIDLAAERREERAFIIRRQYGWIRFVIGNSSVPVAQYRLLRRQGSGDFILLKAIAPSELQGTLFQMADKYLEKGKTYVYRVEAYDRAGQLIGISEEKAVQ